MRTAIERTPGSNSLTVNGPVPMAVVKSFVPSWTIRKWKVPRMTGRSALGLARSIVSSWSDTFWTAAIWSASDFTLEPTSGSLCRFSE